MREHDHDYEGNTWADLFGAGASADEWLAEWMAAKAAEKEAVDRRRSAEDRLIIMLGVGMTDGTETRQAGGYEVKITQRMTRSVDADLLQSLAADAGLSDHLSDLFRWKPELNKKQWDHSAENIRAALAPAITEKPGRPSFSITKATKG